MGNHDEDKRNLYKAMLEWVKYYHELNINKQLIVLCHYPFLTWKNGQDDRGDNP